MGHDHHVQGQGHGLDKMEYILRHMSIAMGIYLLGTHHYKLGGTWVSQDNMLDVAKVFGTIAWGASVAIKLMAYRRTAHVSGVKKEGVLLLDHL